MLTVQPFDASIDDMFDQAATALHLRVPYESLDQLVAARQLLAVGSGSNIQFPYWQFVSQNMRLRVHPNIPLVLEMLERKTTDRKLWVQWLREPIEGYSELTQTPRWQVLIDSGVEPLREQLDGALGVAGHDDVGDTGGQA